ncbi:sushi, von Willebrand factor type A, EGF and pentraxin domain-containing protein 1-like [Asterias rubens]|uniref:sushi, von Willebrand factor type A, EGF and pentraxin domain-containing protein 1-like n=1 Tax=Asterias rubens TaxID=7604 RepID=UPI00145571B6|nr:sushi, von Willebrand factor type A, EGF and pentraxin domain-containing protein 1-like [Asterias rubens]
MWTDSMPECNPINCPTLTGVNCTKGFEYNSICTHFCQQPGFSIAQGQTGVRVCDQAGHWTGSHPKCVDKQKPSLTCPKSANAYANAGETFTSVSWELPTAADNSKTKVEVVQTAGLPPRGTFGKGSHIIQYEALDGSGNRATCEFSVVVQVIQCPTRLFRPAQIMRCTSLFIYGSVCHFSCSPGYVLDGEETNECMQQVDSATGTWSAEQPHCTVLTCPQLTPPENGMFFGNTSCLTTYGSWCQFECDAGYQVVGSRVRRCHAQAGESEGFWEGYDTQCKKQTCPRAYVAPHAFITNQDECPLTDQVPAGSRCHYACLNGHALTGSAEVNCGSDGQWESMFPHCEAVTCDSSELLQPENGIKNGCPNEEEVFGTTCTLICNQGFMPTQPTYVTCTDDGNGFGVWDKNTVTCEEVQCNPLEIPSSQGYMPITCTHKNIEVMETDQLQRYETVCEMSCASGFTSTGTGSRMCQLNGLWDGTPLQCIDITPPLVQCPASITLYAEQGTTFTGNTYGWEPVQATDASGDVIANLVTINDMEVAANRSTILSEGFHLLVYEGEDTSGNVASCVLSVSVLVTRCPPLFGPRNSETSLLSGHGDCDQSTVYGSVCKVDCLEGYTLSPGGSDVRIRCNKKQSSSTLGFWEDTDVDCIPSTCKVPALTNAYLSGCIGTEVDYQTSCAFVCDRGYHRNQTSRTTRTCLADGMWTGDEFSCEAVSCRGFLSVENGAIEPEECTTESDLPFDTRCTFTCVDGFTLKGSSITTCNADGVWSSPTTVSCIDQEPPVFDDNCPLNFTKTAPKQMREAFVYFKTPTATDNSGFVNVHISSRHLASGSSFPEGFTSLNYIANDKAMNSKSCQVYITVQVLRCFTLEAPASGSLSKCPSVILGSTCNFSCNEGYNLLGDESRTCEQVKGKVAWSGATPLCKPITCPALANDEKVIRSGCRHFPPASEFLGTTCFWDCPYGYGGLGSSQSRCRANGEWDIVDFRCEERQCEPLVPATGLEIVPAECLISPDYNDECSLRCSKSGYTVNLLYTSVICLGSGDWSQNITEIKCIDYEKPHFTTCPTDFTTYLPESSLEATVQWKVLATDNSGETPSVKCSLQQPALLTEGNHYINCTAVDTAANQAYCNFEVAVKVRRCLELNPPIFGEFIGSCNNSYGSTCRVRCTDGYVLNGRDTAKCSRDINTGSMSWYRDSSRPTCQIVKCSPLLDVVPENGGVSPAYCQQTSSFFGTSCQFYCNYGFELIDPMSQMIVSCQPDGSWSTDINDLQVKCRDILQPYLTKCPGSKVAFMSGETLGVNVFFTLPTALDNSNDKLTVVKTPSNIDSPYNFTKDTNVSYVFSDAAGNSVECFFRVEVQDDYSPLVEFCPDDINITTTTTKTQVVWPKPMFRELTGDKLNISPSHRNGTEFPQGTFNILYTATNTDNSKTSLCKFTVTISGTRCPKLEPPINGATACHEFPLGEGCTMLCNENHDIARSDKFSVRSLLCFSDGVWFPSGKFPDCTGKKRPLGSKVLASVNYFSGDCSSAAAQTQIETQFVTIFTTSTLFRRVCSGACTVDNVIVTCGRIRNRRSIQESPLNYPTSLDLNGTINAVRKQEFTEHVHKWLTVLRNNGTIPRDTHDVRHRRFVTSKSRNQLNLRIRRDVHMTHTISIEFNTVFTMPNMSDGTVGEDKMYDIVDSLINMANDGELGLSVPDLEIDPQPDVSYEEPELLCPHGFSASLTYSCVGCPYGMFFDNSSKTCKECAIGEYQNEEAQYNCKMCPLRTSTITTGSKNHTDCLGICPRGQFSISGLETCSKCAKGSYQTQEMSTKCHQCPVGQSTARIGATESAECIDLCSTGTYSKTGLQPCTPCPRHTYQPEEGQGSCYPCPIHKITQSTGASSLDMCLKQLLCKDSSCVNGGTCVELGETYHCECPHGLTGQHCESNINDCHLDSCYNGGTCVDKLNGFSCLCSDGFEGDDCSIEINECLSDPCQNEGTCNDKLNGFKCICNDGFTGVICQTDIDECQDLPCLNDGSCINREGDYECACLSGSTGENCETDINECQSNPCQHNASCIDAFGLYYCHCGTGYSGSNCEEDIDLCADNLCASGATCQDLDDRYKCACPRGRGGVHCETVLDLCYRHPCENEGHCLHSSIDERGYTCECRTGFIGMRCEMNLDECLSEPCSNGGTCHDLIGMFECSCTEGFSGPRCEVHVDLCSPNPCQHNAPCEDEGEDYYCTCPAGLSGQHCEIELDLCQSRITCLNSGTCAPPSSGKLCFCWEGFGGEYCEINLDDCAEKPCMNNGLCLDGINSFTCKCWNGFTGTQCEIQINECESSPCLNDGTCVDQTNEYQCICAPGFTGTECGTNQDDCFVGACENGQCLDGVASFSCVCSSGFSGRRCDVEINECQSYPCVNGGTCRDLVDGFTCDCANGWVGNQCEINEDDCRDDPCGFNGRCIDNQGFYMCSCFLGFTGRNCETNIDECQRNPCRNNGRCIDRINSFSCICTKGFKGTLCQIKLGYCQPNPCKHGGRCLVSAHDFHCQCQSGFEGEICEVNKDDCNGHQCLNGAECVDQMNRYMCRCTPGYTGRFCQTQLDICAAEPCQNGAHCLPSGNQNNHCECEPGFTGILCEVTIDNCHPNPCLHGSKCINGFNSHTCNCAPGFTGVECAINVDECNNHSCMNDAQCIDGMNDYQCMCRRGFAGRFCDEDSMIDFDMVFQDNLPKQFVRLQPAISETLSEFTLSLWIRTMTLECTILSYNMLGYRAIEAAEFALRRPEALEVYIKGVKFSSTVSVNDNRWHHLAIMWNNRGHLLIYKDGVLMFRIRNRNGSDDQIEKDGQFLLGQVHGTARTTSDVGLNGSLSNINLWDTIQDSQFIGKLAQECGLITPGNVIAASDFIESATLGDVRIETPSLCDVVDDCASNPCHSGSVCQDKPGYYTCQCLDGFTGQHCEININECETAPCLNGGSCVDGIGTFTCVCLPIFGGRLCEALRGDGGFTEWNAGTPCSRSCGGGTKTQTRFCTNPSPSNGGRECQGFSTKIISCNTQPCQSCKELDHPRAGVLHCDENDNEQNCTISCQEGFEFSQAVTSYQCGPSTNYQWSHESIDNPAAILPGCTRYKPPTGAVCETKMVYRNLRCQGNEVERDASIYELIKSTVQSNLDLLECVKDQTCAVKQIQVSRCSLKKEHQVFNLTFRLESDADIQDEVNLTNKMVLNRAAAKKAIASLENAALFLYNQSSNGNFDVNVDGTFYELNYEETSWNSAPVCSNGTVRFATQDTRCVPCTPGWFTYDGDACRPCPRGTYQPGEGSTHCIYCPKNATTNGEAKTKILDCV